jgi:hypothetical protein
MDTPKPILATGWLDDQQRHVRMPDGEVYTERSAPVVVTPESIARARKEREEMLEHGAAWLRGEFKHSIVLGQMGAGKSQGALQ